MLPGVDGELAGLVVLVEGEGLTLSAAWKARAVNYNRWLRHYPQVGNARDAMARVLWGDPSVSTSRSSSHAGSSFLLACAHAHMFKQADMRCIVCTRRVLGFGNSKLPVFAPGFAVHTQHSTTDFAPFALMHDGQRGPLAFLHNMVFLRKAGLNVTSILS